MFDPESINKATIQLLEKSGKFISINQLFRDLIRVKAIKIKNYSAWLDFQKIILDDVKKGENSIFAENNHQQIGLKAWLKERDRLMNENPKTLVYYRDEKAILKERIDFFIPELNCYWICLNPDKKREHFESEQFLIREAQSLMVIDDNQKKKKIFRLLKELSKITKQLNNDDIDLILDLDENLIYYDKDLYNIDKSMNLDYINYKVNKLDSIEYRKIVDYYLYQK